MHEGTVQEIILDVKVHSLDLCLLILEATSILILLEDVVSEKVPEFKANFEKFFLWDIWALNYEIETCFSKLFQEVDVHVILHCVGCLFDQSQIALEHWCDSQANLSAEILKASEIFRIWRR